MLSQQVLVDLAVYADVLLDEDGGALLVVGGHDAQDHHLGWVLAHAAVLDGWLDHLDRDIDEAGIILVMEFCVNDKELFIREDLTLLLVWLLFIQFRRIFVLLIHLSALSPTLGTSWILRDLYFKSSLMSLSPVLMLMPSSLDSLLMFILTCSFTFAFARATSSGVNTDLGLPPLLPVSRLFPSFLSLMTWSTELLPM